MRTEVIFDNTPVEMVVCCECGRRHKWKQKGGHLTQAQLEVQKKKYVCGRCERRKKQVTNKWYDQNLIEGVNYLSASSV